MNEMMNDPQLDHYLQTHYQNRYGPPPDPALMWERIAPHLASQKQGISWWNNLLPITRQLHRPRLCTTCCPIEAQVCKVRSTGCCYPDVPPTHIHRECLCL